MHAQLVGSACDGEAADDRVAAFGFPGGFELFVGRKVVFFLCFRGFKCISSSGLLNWRIVGQAFEDGRCFFSTCSRSIET